MIGKAYQNSFRVVRPWKEYQWERNRLLAPMKVSVFFSVGTVFAAVGTCAVSGDVSNAVPSARLLCRCVFCHCRLSFFPHRIKWRMLFPIRLYSFLPPSSKNNLLLPFCSDRFCILPKGGYKKRVFPGRRHSDEHLTSHNSCLLYTSPSPRDS